MSSKCPPLPTLSPPSSSSSWFLLLSTSLFFSSPSSSLILPFFSFFPFLHLLDTPIFPFYRILLFPSSSLLLSLNISSILVLYLLLFVLFVPFPSFLPLLLFSSHSSIHRLISFHFTFFRYVLFSSSFPGLLLFSSRSSVHLFLFHLLSHHLSFPRSSHPSAAVHILKPPPLPPLLQLACYVPLQARMACF